MVVAPAAADLAGELKDDALFDKPRCTYPRFFSSSYINVHIALPCVILAAEYTENLFFLLWLRKPTTPQMHGNPHIAPSHPIWQLVHAVACRHQSSTTCIYPHVVDQKQQMT